MNSLIDITPCRHFSSMGQYTDEPIVPLLSALEHQNHQLWFSSVLIKLAASCVIETYPSLRPMPSDVRHVLSR